MSLLHWGARGALWVHNNGEMHFPSPKVKPVDTVGAGDCFTGWLTAGVSAKGLVPEAIELAVRAAAYSVMNQGAQISYPFAMKM